MVRVMLEVLRQDYIRTAWSKGLREGIVVYRHALKNALIPAVTIYRGRISSIDSLSQAVYTIAKQRGLESRE